MKKLLASVVCLSLVGLVATAGGDKAKIDGTWLLTGVVAPDGKVIPADDIAKAMATGVFKDGKYAFSFGAKVAESGTYKTDSTQTPATIDLMIVEGNPKEKGMKQLGIYKIEGDTLTVAVSKPGSTTRPKVFEATKEMDVGVQILKRQK